MRFLLSLLAVPLLVSASSSGGLSGISLVRSASGIVGRQSASACDTSCSSASDEAALQAFAACSASDITCLCTSAAALSSTCLQCMLTNDGVTEAELQAECSAGASATAPSGTTPTSAAPTSIGVCTSECSSATDLAAYNQVQVSSSVVTYAYQQCNATDVPCLCAALALLSSSCSTCVETTFQITQAELNSVCSSGGGSVTSTGSGATNTGSSGGPSVSGAANSGVPGSGGPSPSTPTSPPKSAAERVTLGCAVGAMVFGVMVVLA
ncbi:hypothetical protein CALVIDRAFT_526980 [Calocera viscosa TUFC12733]|uniref:Extracellular membrane protein CFEM domain-containing protein n=1 Tax=Calocera viscosa (strain TUFC12733) TaxID=1330018 RepID=A0A167MTN5_CALVF|nr:hypothetical protein CALVIDRAFT_526980 [Calocera viscosa TUFC12733]